MDGVNSFGEMRGMSDFEREMWNGGYGPSGMWWMQEEDPDERMSDGSIPNRKTAPNPDPYRDAEHAVGCEANDLDPLDHTSCTCGLRATINPWGRRHP